MRALLIGCEYAGTTTLAEGIRSWSHKVMGKGKGLRAYHDHWKIPHTSGHVGLDDENIFTPEEQEQFLALSPKAKEMFQRHNITYHVQPDALRNPNYLSIGLHIENAIYAPMYFDYYVGDQAWARRAVMEHVEDVILEFAPTMPLVLVKASPEAITDRMKSSPHPNQVISEQDIGRVLDEFEAEFQRSAIGNKLTIDTTDATADETLAQFLEQFEPHLNETDALRILTNKARQSGDWP
jgi:hypothetical protein